MQFVDVRVFFSKTGCAKYISQLDLNGVLQRTLRKSGLPVWFTEGFNPHIYSAFALPLPLGQCGLCESFDFRLTDEVDGERITNQINMAFPPDIKALRAARPLHKYAEITSASYTIEGGFTAKEFSDFFSRDAITVTKKTKRGQSDIDLKTLMTEVNAEDKKVSLKLPAGGTFNVNPALVVNAFAEHCGRSLKTEITRTGIFIANGDEFV